jgi:hypothetical protein
VDAQYQISHAIVNPTLVVLLSVEASSFGPIRSIPTHATRVFYLGLASEGPPWIARPDRTGLRLSGTISIYGLLVRKFPKEVPIGPRACVPA